MSKLRLRPALRHWAHGLHVRGGGGPALDPDALTLIAAMSDEPDATRKALISDTIIALKNAGIWSELDECWFLAAHAEQAALLGWKRYKDCVAVNAPTFTTDEGFAGNGSTSYLNTQFVPSTDGVQYTLDSASAGVWNRTEIAHNGRSLGAVIVGERLEITVRTDSKAFTIAVNQSDSSVVVESDVENSIGLRVAQRINATTVEGYVDGVRVNSLTVASGELPSLAVLIGGRNQAGGLNLPSPRQHAFAFVGAAMTEGQQEDLYEIVQDYMTAIGANV